jgi:tetratricopeptide (TPR) repeat protein
LWAEAFNGRGSALLELGRVGEALAAFSAAIELDPNSAEAYFNRAQTLEAQGSGRLMEALADYNQAIELEPHDAEFYFRRGGLYFQYGDYGLAAMDNTQVIEMHTGVAQTEVLIGPYIARGLSYYQLERLDDAIADYSKAVEIDPRGAADAYFYRALAYIDQEQALPARADLQAFLTLTPDSRGEMATQAREIIQELDMLSSMPD